MIALAMIITMWIAVRMTFLAIEGSPAADMQRVARSAAPPHLAVAAPLRPRAAVPYLLRRNAGSALRRPLPEAAADYAPVTDSRYMRPALGPPSASRPLPADMFAAGSATPAGETGSAAPTLLAYLAPPSAPSGDGSAQAEDDPGKIMRSTRPRLPRWTADGWLLLRGDQAPALTAGAAAYGGSQAGAVLRYGLVPASRLRPQAYLRVSTALGPNVRQNEAALGLMVRPVRGLPVALLGEWRLQEQSGQTRTRPVVMVVTELPPLRLPLAVEAEAYAQAGWAGGRGATPFYDLAATFERRIAQPLPDMTLQAGGGVWSGGQRGAVRLDLGPRIELRGMLGPSSRRIGVRVGVDWRFRVAGRAKPGSGPALTVAAGF